MGAGATTYAGSATMVIPEDFLAALQRATLFTIYHRLHRVKRPQTRQKRMAALFAKLGWGESF